MKTIITSVKGPTLRPVLCSFLFGDDSTGFLLLRTPSLYASLGPGFRTIEH